MVRRIYVGGAKSDNMVEDISSNCFEEAVQINKEEYKLLVNLIDGEKIINCWGHPNNSWNLPQAVDKDGNRLTVKMQLGDILAYEQHIGQRRNECGEVVGEATTGYFITKVVKRSSNKDFNDFVGEMLSPCYNCPCSYLECYECVYGEAYLGDDY